MLGKILDWLAPEPTKQRSDDCEVRAALAEGIDTGNALFDSFAALLIEQDAFEVEQALMLEPEEKDRHIMFYVNRWRELYVSFAMNELYPERYQDESA